MTHSSRGIRYIVVEPKPKSPPKAYEKIRSIGSGGQADVHLVRRRSDNKVYVCKVESDPPSDGRSEEIRILKKLGPHPRIIDMIDYVSKPCDIQLILDYHRGGDLADLIEDYMRSKLRFDEAFIRHVFLQLVEALAFIHKGVLNLPTCKRRTPKSWTSIVHRDIKPANVFLNREYRGHRPFPMIILADFGWATTEKRSRGISTPTWQPPEMPLWTHKGDVWAVGAVVHTLAHLSNPIQDRPAGYKGDWYIDPRSINPKNLSDRYSHNLNRVMMKALERKPEERSDALDLIERLEDY